MRNDDASGMVAQLNSHFLAAERRQTTDHDRRSLDAISKMSAVILELSDTLPSLGPSPLKLEMARALHRLATELIEFADTVYDRLPVESASSDPPDEPRAASSL